MRKLSLLLVLPLLLIAASALRHGTARAASSQVYMNQTCAAGKANVTFSWIGSDTLSQQQWIDLSTSDNGWQDGTYISAGPIAGSATSYTWDGLVASTAHVVRVNQQLASGAWDSSGTFSLTTIDCAAPPAGVRVPSVARPTLLGFSDHIEIDPSALTPSGGSLRNCSPIRVYVFIDLPSAQQLAYAVPKWTFNGSTIATAFPQGSPSIVGSFSKGLTAGFSITTTNNNGITGPGVYAVTVSFEPGVDPVQGSFTVTC